MIKYINGNKALDLKFYKEKILYNPEALGYIKAEEVTWEAMFQKTHPR